MARSLIFIVLLLSSTFSFGQFAEFLMTVDNSNGSFTRINKISDARWVSVGFSSSSIDQDNDRYIFYGKDHSDIYKLYTIDINTGTLLYNPKIDNPKNNKDQFTGLHYIGNNTVAGLFLKGNARAEAEFIHIDIITGKHKIISVLKNVKAVAFGTPVYNKTKKQYTFISTNGGGLVRLTTIDVATGAVVLQPILQTGTFGYNYSGLKINNRTGNLYCITKEVNGTGKLELVSLNLISGARKPIKQLNYTGISIGPSFVTFNEKNGHYICRLGSFIPSVTKLVSIDVNTGNINSSVSFDAPANPQGSGNSLTRPNIIELNYHENSGKIIALGWREVGSWVPPVAPPTPPTPPVPPVTPVGIPDSNSFIVSIPDAFTPNGDGLNEIFKPIFSQNTTYTMSIYSKWGEKLKNCANCSWNGKYKGQLVQPDTYIYIIVIKNIGSDTKRMFKGAIHVMW